MIKEKLKHIYERINKHLQTRHGQVYFLTRHFMAKLINNSLIKSESHEVGSLLVAVILFALAGALISHNLLVQYLVGATLIEPQMVWVEKTFFMIFMMSMMGIICAVVRNNLFLDKQDYDNLLTLPIKLRKMPFVSSYLPGQSKFKYWGMFYIIAFIFYLWQFTALGLFLIKYPGYYLAFYPGALMIYMLFKGYQYKKNREYNFIYEEEPEAFFLSLDLDQYTNARG